MKRSMIIWAAAILLVAVAIYTTTQYKNSPTPVQEPEPVVDSMAAIDFSLKDLNGKQVALSDFKGKTIYVNLWATWCGYCTLELPYIEQLYQDAKDSDLVVLTVDLQETAADVSKFMTEKNYSFPVLLDTKGEVANMYGVQGIPLSLLIDKDFNIISVHEGYMESYDMLKEFVDQQQDNK